MFNLVCSRKNYGGLPFAAAVMFSAGVGVLATSQAASADVAGFGSATTVTTSSSTVNGGNTYTEDNGTVTLNANSNAATDTVPSIGTDGSNLHLTNYNSNDATSVWFNQKQNIATPWQTSFTFSSGGNPTGMGFFFTIQNNADGVHLLGGANREYGLLTVDNGGAPPVHTLGIGVDNSNNASNIMLTYDDGNGNELDGYGDRHDASVSGITLGGNQTADITISYDGNMNLTFAATQGGNMFIYTYTLPETLSTIVNGDTGYIGFTGSTDGYTEAQNISDFSFSAVPEPASLVLLVLGGMMLLLPRRWARA